MNATCYVAAIKWPTSHNAIYLKKLPYSEQQEALRYSHPERLRSFIASRLLLRHSLSLHENRHLVWQFLRHNKRLILDKTQTNLHTSLSHSQDWVACVLSIEPHCGIDIETNRINPRFMAIAQRFFAPQEYDYLMQLATLDAWTVFLDFWTRKEACVKAWHTGLANHLAELSFMAHTNNPVSYPLCYQSLPLNVFCYTHTDWQLATAIHSHHQPTKPQLIEFNSLF